MKKVITLNESQFKHIIAESVKRILNEYGEPEHVLNELILYAYNTKEIYKMMQWVVNALRKKKRRGVEISKDILVRSSIIYKIAQTTVRIVNQVRTKYGDPPYYIDNETKRTFRDYLAQEILDDVNSYED